MPLSFSILFRIFASMLLFASLAGRVLDNSGKPLAGVRLESGDAQAETDANGNFHFDSPYSVIFALKEGFTPQAYIVKTGETAITLKMASETGRLEFPRCSEEVANLNAPAVLPLGNGLVTPIPKTLQHESKDYGEAGHEEYSQTVNKGEKLTYQWSVSESPDLPLALYILASKQPHIPPR